MAPKRADMPGMTLSSKKRRGGFTLLELVVVIIILAVLAGIAIPRFIDLGSRARAASVATFAGALRAAVDSVHTACYITPSCDLASPGQYVMFNGKTAYLNYGWLDAGDYLGYDQVDVWITYTGFTASLPSTTNTRFSLDGAPDPPNCSVTYFDAFSQGAASGPLITQAVTGC